MGFLNIQVVVFGLVAVSPWCPGARMPKPGWSVPVFALLGGRTTDYRLQTTDYRLQTADYRLQTTLRPTATLSTT